MADNKAAHARTRPDKPNSTAADSMQDPAKIGQIDQPAEEGSATSAPIMFQSAQPEVAESPTQGGAGSSSSNDQATLAGPSNAIQETSNGLEPPAGRCFCRRRRHVRVMTAPVEPVMFCPISSCCNNYSLPSLPNLKEATLDMDDLHEALRRSLLPSPLIDCEREGISPI
ncbi:hypothetical protein PG994_008633 [Apiospora phragmitis]|uniref:Uncharacterized protein n=1 Tax=Apiospora phragmitis TaxID=2905665 RepID=A0ABR1UH08_9PEZI